MIRKIEIMDTTLRDGEQTSGVTFHPKEKLQIARLLLEEIKVDRIEVASARVSEGEFEAVRQISGWAAVHGQIDRVEVLGFVDGKTSIDWILKAGCNVLNLLCKGSEKHAREQLRKSPEEHLNDIRLSVEYALASGLTVNLYLEDWSNGMIHSPEYVFFMVDHLKEMEIKRIMLPDTLGILNHEQAYEFCKTMLDRYPGLHFDFHAHNDYDLATANVFAAIRAGVQGVHTTVNGLGERAGNVALSSVIGILNDHLKVKTRLDESKLTQVSRLVENFSGIRIPASKPLIGENVFTQTCGVHADGDHKSRLYFNALLPERFGRTRKYALGKTSGLASIRKNLEELGLNLDEETMRKLTERVIELGDKKENVTTEDLPFIISDILENGTGDYPIKILNYALSLNRGMKPLANIAVEIHGQLYEESANGDGQYDAFMNALWKIYGRLDMEHPVLTDYAVSIPPGGRTDALVETAITWSFRDREFRTRAVDSDQTEAAIKATSKMLNIIEKI